MNILNEAQKVLDIEAQAILALKDRVADSFLQAVELIGQSQGKVITTGIGKSGIIARKIASTFSSTGTPSVFLHPAESSHGDLGVIEKGDIIIAISYRGEALELTDILNFAARKGHPIIAVTGSLTSSLARAAKIVLDVSVSQEACPMGLAPTASTTATLALGDSLAMAVLIQRGFSPSDFAEYHPGGALGRKLLTRVRDVMHSGDALPIVSPEVPMREVLSVMTKKEVRGAAGVINSSGSLIGVLTDGDLRRQLEKSEDPLKGTVSEIMTKSPKTIDADELAERALFIMEQFKIQLLFVVDKNSNEPLRPVGVVHLQDLLKAQVR